MRLRPSVCLLCLSIVACDSQNGSDSDSARADSNGVRDTSNLAQVETRVLSNPEAEFAESFTVIAGIRELKDGRVLLLDSREGNVHVIDLRSGRSERVGRTGRGPGEYSLPVALIPLAGDSSGIIDKATRRILVVLPDGTTGGIHRLQVPFGASDRSLFQLHGADVLGRVYLTGTEYHMVNGSPVRADSVPIIRWMPGQTRADSVAWVRQQAITVGAFARGRAQGIAIGDQPFAGQDQWTVDRDGRIAVADPDNYQIRWTDPAGRRSESSPNAFNLIRLTDAHKEEWRAKQRAGVTVMEDDDRGTAVTTPTRRVEDPPSWPEYLPPFLRGALKFAPDGTLWVRRTGPAGMAPTFDRINAQGQVIQQVVLARRTRLLGFGANGTVYVARSDDNDLEYLQRFRIE